MEIIRLEKHADIGRRKAIIKVEIEVGPTEGYDKLDLFPDSMIPDLLLAVGRKYVIKRQEIANVTENVLKERQLL